MTTYHGRAFHREETSASLLWSDLKMGNCHKARLRNKSPAGIYFESARDCPPGAIIRIQRTNRDRDLSTKDPIQGSHARVLWKKEIHTPLRYGMGARYLLWKCSLCGKLLDPDNHWDTEGIHLCSRCGQKINGLTDGALKKGIEQFLSGNVI